MRGQSKKFARIFTLTANILTPMCVNIEMRPAPVSPRREVVNPVRPEREQR